MQRIYFTQLEAQARLGKTVRVAADTLYDVRRGTRGRIIGMALLDRDEKGYGVTVKWDFMPPGFGPMMAAFTKSEYERYLCEEESESSPKITYD